MPEQTEKELKQRGTVLTRDGTPNPGWSRRMLLSYNRKEIHASPFRIKEWDWYQIQNDHLCLQFTIGHASYAGQVDVMLFDFVKGEKIFEKSRILALPFNSLHMPSDAEADGRLAYDKGGVFVEYVTKGCSRTITCRWDNVESRIVMEHRHPDSLVLNVPFNENPHDFYYNEKINCMPGSGFVRRGNDRWTFDEKDSFGILDWGRGVWPFHNEWYWSNGTCYIEGKLFGFNTGCGFGNSSTAGENIVFYDGASYKLGRTDFFVNTDDYLQPWHIRDREQRLDLTLTPCYDRKTSTKLLWIDNCTHQMYGKFTGTVVLSETQKLHIDNVYSFAEHAVNNW
jgi:hypothetical protein